MPDIPTDGVSVAGVGCPGKCHATDNEQNSEKRIAADLPSHPNALSPGLGAVLRMRRRKASRGQFCQFTQDRDVVVGGHGSVALADHQEALEGGLADAYGVL